MRHILLIGWLMPMTACGGGVALAPAADFPGTEPHAAREAAVVSLTDMGFRIAESSPRRIVTAWVPVRELECPGDRRCRAGWTGPRAPWSPVTLNPQVARIVVEIPTAGPGPQTVRVEADFKGPHCRRTRDTFIHWGAIETRDMRVNLRTGEITHTADPARIGTRPDLRYSTTETTTECREVSIASSGRLERQVLDSVGRKLVGT